MLHQGRWRLVIGMLPVVAVLATGPGLPSSRSAAPARVGGGRPMGSGSCSATACHGSIRPVGGSNVRRDEHTTWIAHDPHARAFAVLHNATSERIARNLAGGQASYQPAYEDARCLACHTTPRTPADLAATAWQNEDGVGCEACHGPASGWIGPHTVVGWSRQFSAQQKEASFGLTATKDLARRVEVCAGCHVGRRDDPTGIIDRDINHDLIAAGHPRLNFEFSAYQANQPPHWVEKGQNAAADFPARAWVVGQVATAKAAAELLHGRAADRSAPWPEFSEYDCYACHHSLADQAWRQTPSESRPRLGQPEWASWSAPMTLELAADGTLGDAAVASAFEQARGAVGGPWDVREEGRREATRRADDLARALGGWLGRVGAAPLDAGTVGRWVDALNSPDGWAKVHNWDGAAQRYLGLVPLRQGLVKLDPARDDPRLRDELVRLLGRLRFPPGEDGPGRQFSPANVLER